MSQPAVELLGITRRFGAVTALDAVDLTIAAGEFLTLLGPSGCGKTTLLRVIGGFETPDAGAVRIAGRDMTAVPPYRRPVNTVFQNYALFPHLSVGENIAFGLKMLRVPAAEIRTRVGEALALVSLPGLEQRRPHQLSGGQRQRVALARALVCRPQVLLLDEPLAALDAKLRHEMQHELKQLQRQLKITFIFVTHDQQEALAMSDRIALLKAGRVEQLDTPPEIYGRPRTPFAADFIGRANLIEAVVQSVAETQLVCTSPEGRWVASGGAGDRAIGSRVTLMVRPEHVRVAAAEAGRTPDASTDEASPNRFSAEVVAVAFKGFVHEAVLKLPSGLLVTALTTQSWSVGAQVVCSVSLRQVSAL